MRAGVNAFITACAGAIGLASALASPCLANDDVERPGADQWAPSFAFLVGATVQTQSGTQSSLFFDEGAAVGVPLRDFERGDDLVVSAYIGGEIELMTPQIPELGGVRFFVTGEILPHFAAERRLAQEGQPTRIKGPEVGAVLVDQETPTFFNTSRTATPGQGRPHIFGEDEANGQGGVTVAQIQPLVFGARAGFAVPLELRGRPLLIKPSVGWIRFWVEADGLLVDPTCNPTTICTNTYSAQNGQISNRGFTRESILKGGDTRDFDGIGGIIDLEMGTGRFGPIGTSLFLSAGAYYVLGDREIAFGANAFFDDQLGQDRHSATWKVRVAPVFYRAGAGFRLQWLGSAK